MTSRTKIYKYTQKVRTRIDFQQNITRRLHAKPKHSHVQQWYAGLRKAEDRVTNIVSIYYNCVRCFMYTIT